MGNIKDLEEKARHLKKPQISGESLRPKNTKKGLEDIIIKDKVNVNKDMKLGKKTKETSNLLDNFLKDQLKNKNYTSGEIIKLHRERLDLSQVELANATGISVSDIEKYESNMSVVENDVAIKLATNLSIHHDSILYPNN